ncbi:MAG: hypothetical protein K0B01_12195 [Syntrophobacterales bacterium]|nr:hypothetical protein [Syntrophobacterales bacterium]
METIHFKTVDPISQELLRDASRRGIGLNWERYEKQQPQDGFLRLGLSCPYGCMQGPCRIDPYGRGTQSGLCGLERDGMVAAFLLRLSLQGALETMALHPDSAEIAFPASLASRAAAVGTPCGKVFPETGNQPLSFAEILASVRMLARPSAAPETLIRQAIRLGLLGVGLHGQEKIEPAIRAVQVGYGLLAGEAIRVGVAGRIPQTAVEALLKETAGTNNPEVRLVSLGDWIPGGANFLPIVCTTGEAESVISSGKLNLLLAGEGTDPGVLSLCEKMNVAIIFAANSTGTAEILKRAREAFDRRPPAAFAPAAALIAAGQAALGDKEILSALKNSGAARIALIGGADTLLQSLGHLPTELAKALRAEDHAVASWGDAALWMMKQELPVGVLDAQEGPMAAVRALAEAGRLSSLRGICFTGLRNSREFTVALGLAALGLKVLIATPLPLWGSEKVRALLCENLAGAGGILGHFDHPLRPDEVLDWFLRS